jgi:hypothetical protein
MVISAITVRDASSLQQRQFELQQARRSGCVAAGRRARIGTSFAAVTGALQARLHNSHWEVHMSAREKVAGVDMRLRALLVSVGLLAALFLLAPRDLQGAKSWKQCIDGSFADYNSCLSSTDSRFEKFLCDVAWEIDVVVCSSRAAGDVRDGYERGSDA